MNKNSNIIDNQFNNNDANKHLNLFSSEYYKEFVAKNNTSARDRIWDLSTFRGECLILDH